MSLFRRCISVERSVGVSGLFGSIMLIVALATIICAVVFGYAAVDTLAPYGLANFCGKALIWLSLTAGVLRAFWDDK